ncbi:MAG: hypothetical protein ACK5MO_14320 [Planctomyces sp.]
MKHLALQLSLLAALAGCSGSSSEPPAATAAGACSQQAELLGKVLHGADPS